jgi:hypothetical protein
MLDWTRGEINRLADLIWQARVLLDRLNAAHCSPQDKADALRVWDKVAHAYEQNQQILEELAAAPLVGLSPLKLYLRMIEPELRRARLYAKNGEIKKAKQKRGHPGRPFGDKFDISMQVNDLREGGMTHEVACYKIAKQLGMREDNVRRIYRQYRAAMLFLRKKAHMRRIIALLKGRSFLA